MDTSLLVTRFDRLAGSATETHPGFEVSGDASGIVCRTGERYVQIRRLFVRIFGAALVLGGLVFTLSSTWGLGLVALGSGIFILAPRLVRVAELLRIDADAGHLVVLQHAAATGARIPLSDVHAIEGVYKIQGWDGDCTIYAVHSDGAHTPILVFPGTNEALARYACHALGLLLDCPATYSGAFDGMTVCYAPETGGLHSPLY